MSRTLGKKLLGGLLTLCVIGALSLLLTEAAVRLLLPQESPALWLTPDARYGHLMKPNFHQRYPFPQGDFVMDVRTNALGFRDEEPAPKQDGVPTVLFAGDSFTFGHGIAVEQRFDYRLEEKLRAAGRPMRLINVGVNAWGTLQATRYLADHLDTFAPDIIVLTFCENDPHDDTYFLEHGISFDRVRFPGKDFLRANSHLFRFLQHSYLVWRKSRAANALPPATQEEADALAEKAQQQEARATAEQAQPAAFAPPISDAQWQRTEGYLKDFMTAWRAKQPKARLLIQSTDPLNPDIRARLDAFADNIPGIEHVDLHPAASNLTLAERRLPYDGHWSPAMHNLSAEALSEALLTK